MCSDCGLIEARYVDEPDYQELKLRWNDVTQGMSYEELRDSVARRAQVEEQRAREWTWPTESDPGTWEAVSDRERRSEKLAEHLEETTYTHTTIVGNELEFSSHRRLPQNVELRERIRAHPDDVEARREFATWLRAQSDPRAPVAADFIEGQLRLADALHLNPRADIKHELPEDSFEARQDSESWWRYPYNPSRGLGAALSDDLAILLEEGLIADLRWYRGFVEHVAVKAHRFLEIADELFSLAPIRHLTITYAKGLDHTDGALWKALVSSPHLDRIRSLRFPVRVLDNEYTELNRLTDADLEILATSSHVSGLRYLDLEDESALTIRAFHALAASPHLRELSAVQFDLYRYDYIGAFTFANVGPRERSLVARPLQRYAAELEARHGRIAWLHPVENYGSETPDLEAVVEHPVRPSH